MGSVIAIDGPSGTGKSTTARRLAKSLAAGYLDTGAMYRAATLAVLRAEVAVSDSAAIAKIVADLHLEISTDPDHPVIKFSPPLGTESEDISREIRGPAVTRAVSPVSAIPAVRSVLVAQQQHIIRRVTESGCHIVIEGRDIGSVVAPQAPLKIYLTADPEVRAARRARQDGAVIETVRADVLRRDTYDSTRALTPLRKTDDAIEVDTTELNIDEVVALLTQLASQRGIVATTKRVHL